MSQNNCNNSNGNGQDRKGKEKITKNYESFKGTTTDVVTSSLSSSSSTNGASPTSSTTRSRKLIDLTKQKADWKGFITPLRQKPTRSVSLNTSSSNTTDNYIYSPSGVKSLGRRQMLARSMTCSVLESSLEVTASPARDAVPKLGKETSSAEITSGGVADVDGSNYDAEGGKDEQEPIQFFLKVPLERKRRNSRRPAATSNTVAGDSSDDGRSLSTISSLHKSIVEELRENFDNSRRRQRRRSLLLLKSANLGSTRSIDSCDSASSFSAGTITNHSYCCAPGGDSSQQQQQQQQQLAIEEQLDREDREALQRHFTDTSDSGHSYRSTLSREDSEPSLGRRHRRRRSSIIKRSIESMNQQQQPMGSPLISSLSYTFERARSLIDDDEDDGGDDDDNEETTFPLSTGTSKKLSLSVGSRKRISKKSQCITDILLADLSIKDELLQRQRRQRQERYQQQEEEGTKLRAFGV